MFLGIALSSAQWVQPTSAQETKDTAQKPVAAGSDELLGEWWTENNAGRISFARYKDGTYRGTTTCCGGKKDDPDSPAIDTKNPNPALRTRSTTGIVIIWNLKFEDGAWVEGHVYNPRDGKTYRMKLALVDHDTLKVRGYMGLEVLGQTQIWKRARPDVRK